MAAAIFLASGGERDEASERLVSGIDPLLWKLVFHYFTRAVAAAAASGLINGCSSIATAATRI